MLDEFEKLELEVQALFDEATALAKKADQQCELIKHIKLNGVTRSMVVTHNLTVDEKYDDTFDVPESMFTDTPSMNGLEFATEGFGKRMKNYGKKALDTMIKAVRKIFSFIMDFIRKTLKLNKEAQKEVKKGETDIVSYDEMIEKIKELAGDNGLVAAILKNHSLLPMVINIVDTATEKNGTLANVCKSISSDCRSITTAVLNPISLGTESPDVIDSTIRKIDDQTSNKLYFSKDADERISGLIEILTGSRPDVSIDTKATLELRRAIMFTRAQGEELNDDEAKAIWRDVEKDHETLTEALDNLADSIKEPKALFDSTSDEFVKLLNRINSVAMDLNGLDEKAKLVDITHSMFIITCKRHMSVIMDTVGAYGIFANAHEALYHTVKTYSPDANK